VLLGGSPLRLVTLSAAGARAWEALAAGRPVREAGPGAGVLARRLVDAGLAHPLPPAWRSGDPPGVNAGAAGGLVAGTPVTAVLPVRDGAAGLGELVEALADRCAEVIVVDDGSSDATSGVAAAAGARVVRHEHPRGPAAARQAGAAAARTPFILFCDADIRLPDVVAPRPGAGEPRAGRRDRLPRSDTAPGPGQPVSDGVGAQAPVDDATGGAASRDPVLSEPSPGDAVERRVDWFGLLLGHLADPAVAAVAPRVASPVPTGRRAGLLARYESARSPLDLGPRAAAVRPGSRVSYVPTAVLLIRRELVGFDPALRYGEDVDLVWRLAAAGWSVRYEPAAVVRHRPRSDWPGWARQRFGYGSSAGPLATRHPAPLRPAGQAGVAAAVALAVAASPGGPRGRALTLAVAAATAGRAVRTASRLSPRLTAAPRPGRLAWVMVLAGRRFALEAAADNIRRGWWPPLVALRPGRRVFAAAVILPAARDWWVTRPAVGFAPYVLLRMLDDAAYSAGVWWGCARAATARPLVPAPPAWLTRAAARTWRRVHRPAPARRRPGA